MAKKTSAKCTDAPVRKRLEALRDDCRRHKRGVVALVQRRNEGRDIELERPFVVARSDDEEHDARAFMDRLGDILGEASDVLTCHGIAAESGGWRRSRWIAKEALLHSRPWFKVIESGATWLEGEEVPKATCVTFERKVPDLFAAIAELCDELLEVKPKAAPKQEKRTDEQKFAQASAILLQEFERSGRMLRQNQVAARIGMTTADLSRLVGKSGRKGNEWRRLKQTFVSRRPGGATPSDDDEGE